MKESEKAYLGAEFFKGVTLNSVDAELGVGLNNSESTRHCAQNMLVIYCLT
jgi:hypothetical protein